MKPGFSLLMLVLAVCLSTASYSDWNKGCLDECFGTGHDCNYCSYICKTEDYTQRTPNYSGDTTCPFPNGYNN